MDLNILSSSFTEITSYLDKLEKFGINQGLDRIKLLLQKLGQPHREYKAIQRLSRKNHE